MIIKETDDWLLVNKPANVSIHSENNKAGFIEQLKAQYCFDYLAPVHRLDKVTSGCLLLAKHSKAASYLSKQFQNRQVDKYYLALTIGKPKKKQGTIVGDMVPSRKGNYKLTQSKQNPAITQFFSKGFQSGIRLVAAKILTGKTHQIRVAMKSIGSPILGDERYALNNKAKSVDRCYLHSYQLIFDDLDGKRIAQHCLPIKGEHFCSKAFIEAVDALDIMNLKWPTYTG